MILLSFLLLLLWTYLASDFIRDSIQNLAVNRLRLLFYPIATNLTSVSRSYTPPSWLGGSILFVLAWLLGTVLLGLISSMGLHVYVANITLSLPVFSLPKALLLTLGSALLLLAQLCTFRLLFAWRLGCISGKSLRPRSSSALFQFLECACWPISSIPNLGLSIAAVALLFIVGTWLVLLGSSLCGQFSVLPGVLPQFQFNGQATNTATSLFLLLRIAFLAFLDTLLRVKDLLILLIFASFVSLFRPGAVIAVIAHEWINDITSAVFGSRRFSFGMLDFSVVIIYFVLQFAHSILLKIL